MATNDDFRTAQRPGRSVDCDGCPAAATTACTDCVVNHVLALDDGPIRLVPRHPSAGNLPRRSAASPTTSVDRDERAVERAVARLVAAGLVVDTDFVAAPLPGSAGVRT